MPSILSPRSLRISGIVLSVCAVLGLAAIALTGRLAPSPSAPPAQDVRAGLLTDLARLRQAQPQGAPGSETQAFLQAELDALRKATPGDPAAMLKQTQRDLERLQAESRTQPPQVQQAIRTARWALALSLIALCLTGGLALKPAFFKTRADPAEAPPATTSRS
jgi:hypothetical protein